MKNKFLSVARVEPGTIGSIAEHSYHYAISASLLATVDVLKAERVGKK